MNDELHVLFNGAAKYANLVTIALGAPVANQLFSFVQENPFFIEFQSLLHRNLAITFLSAHLNASHGNGFSCFAFDTLAPIISFA